VTHAGVITDYRSFLSLITSLSHSDAI